MRLYISFQQGVWMHQKRIQCVTIHIQRVYYWIINVCQFTTHPIVVQKTGCGVNQRKTRLQLTYRKQQDHFRSQERTSHCIRCIHRFALKNLKDKKHPMTLFYTESYHYMVEFALCVILHCNQMVHQLLFLNMKFIMISQFKVERPLGHWLLLWFQSNGGVDIVHEHVTD